MNFKKKNESILCKNIKSTFFYLFHLYTKAVCITISVNRLLRMKHINKIFIHVIRRYIFVQNI